MKLDHLLDNLEILAENLKDPTHNPLYTGFRHSPLTTAEIIQRFNQECYHVRHALLRLIDIVREEGIEK
jgi:hypothetical protein